MFLSWFGGTFVTLKYRKNLFDNLTEWLCVRGGRGTRVYVQFKEWEFGYVSSETVAQPEIISHVAETLG